MNDNNDFQVAGLSGNKAEKKISREELWAELQARYLVKADRLVVLLCMKQQTMYPEKE